LFYVFEDGTQVDECLAKNVVDLIQENGELLRIDLRQSTRA